MPLTPDEVIKLPSEVAALIDAIRDARATESDGGTKITRGERTKLLRIVGRLAFLLTVDLVD
jgi:hypothetical protein